jgi:[ribosomal protein S5]-alanine N-acetyltransferase
MKFPRKLLVKTKRLVIRPYVKSDFDAWEQAYLERMPKQNEFDLGPISLSKIKRASFNKVLSLHTRARAKDRLYVFGIFEIRSKRCVGFLDIYVQARLDSQCANIGYVIHNQFWRRGYAKEAASAIIRLSFKALKLHRIEAGVDPRNTASVAVAKAIGMKYEGTRRSCNFERGSWRDLEYYSIIPGDIRIKSARPSIKTTLRDVL